MRSWYFLIYVVLEPGLGSAESLGDVVPVNDGFELGGDGAYAEFLGGVVDESLVEFAVIL